MINVLIADDNIEYAIKLMNYINNKNEIIRICNIAKDGKETIKILNNSNNIDVILLDYRMPIYNGKQILEQINNKEKYRGSFILISGDADAINLLRNNEMVHSIIYKGLQMDDIIVRINELLEYKEVIKKSKMIEIKIKEEILYLRYNISHKGTQYLMSAIYYIIVNEKKDFRNLKKDVYPYVADIYNETEHNIKCRINVATNDMYNNCEISRLKEYFNINVDEKPTIKMIICTIVDKILQTMN